MTNGFHTAMSQMPQNQGGAGVKAVVCQKIHKTNKYPDQNLTEKEVKRPQEGVRFTTDKLWTQEAPSDAPCPSDTLWS